MNADIIISGLIGAVIGVACLVTLAFLSGRDFATHDEIIERGYGLYCPKTGEFAFVGECEE